MTLQFSRMSVRSCTAALSFIAGLCTAQISATSQCPQPRFTGAAPAECHERKNLVTPDTREIAAGATLYASTARGAACGACHGVKGDGRGKLSSMFTPPPRDFTCARTINDVSDGQLFWIIRFGSPGTAMSAHPHLEDEDIRRLVIFLRQLSRG